MECTECRRRAGGLGGWKWVAVAVGVVAGACVQARGGFESGGYQSTLGYQIPYERGTQSLLPRDWALDNYEHRDGRLAPKMTDRYITHYRVAEEGEVKDPMAETTIRGLTYALRYEHRVHAGVIWLRDIPIPLKLRSKDLRVLMRSYIDELAGAVYETVRGHDTAFHHEPPVVVEHRRAAAVVEEGPALVAGATAYAALIEIADIDALRVDPSARALRVQLVLWRAPATAQVGGYPVILLAAYSNMPAEFARGLDDFHGFLQRLTMSGHAGFRLDLAPAAAPQASAAAEGRAD